MLSIGSEFNMTIQDGKWSTVGKSFANVEVDQWQIVAVRVQLASNTATTSFIISGMIYSFASGTSTTLFSTTITLSKTTADGLNVTAFSADISRGLAGFSGQIAHLRIVKDDAPFTKTDSQLQPLKALLFGWAQQWNSIFCKLHS